MRISLRCLYASIVCATAFLCSGRAAFALDADQLALVVNRNMPESEKLAEFYADARGVSRRRIIELDLPTTENISFSRYETDVVPPIRRFLRLHDPQRKIKCLVTFYGVPFRIDAHEPTVVELAEEKHLAGEMQSLEKQLSAKVDELENAARSFNSQFKPGSQPLGGGASDGAVVERLLHRADNAGKSISSSINQIKDPSQRQTAAMQMVQLVQPFAAPYNPGEEASTSAPSTTAASRPTETSAEIIDPADFPEDRRYDPEVRKYFRQQTAAHGGLFAYAKLLASQIGYLNPQDSEAAFDSELSMLWITFYPRSRWQLNTWCYRFAGAGGIAPLFVSRLDAPEPKTVREIILSSIRAEKLGLKGKVVVDSRGLRPALNGPVDQYAVYDQSLRNLAGLVREKTKLQLTLDESADVLPPHSVSDVAIYVGWYSVGKYVPACSFVPGAVGFHIASFEMVSLRDPANTGWVRGLLNDGVAATLGPVSEPYLQSFPSPDDFFPLLLTGKLTLAEVYWRTTPMTSWRQCLVGDPLYTPFKASPALSVEDLPARLKPVIAAQALGSRANLAGSPATLPAPVR